jgi:hypothetical protein
MIRGKGNISEDVGGLAYGIEAVKIAGGIAAPRVVWGDAVIITAEEALGTRKERGPTAVDAARDWLEEFLADGPKEAKALKAAAEASHHTSYALNAAKNALGVVSAKAGFQAPYYWRLPGDHAANESEFG